MDFMETVKNRYSCKNFDGRPVPQDKLNAILEAGRLAPTAKNLQEQHIYVAQTPQALAKIDVVTPCRYGASTVSERGLRLLWLGRGLKPGAA